VLSWSLDGRKATHLPIPAYRCVGAGEVTVIITVNTQGTVVDAKIDDGASSKDGCLRSFATRAARLSKFNASTTAPARQMGTITYLFIAQ
jgi:TonB family protein